jgi:hypothetical protein
MRSYLGYEKLIAESVLGELFYMLTSRVGYEYAAGVFNKTRVAFDIISITDEDRLVMGEIMTRYEDAEFDYADVSIMAVAERLNITQIMTFDRRDFTMFRPRHCEYLELLP